MNKVKKIQKQINKFKKNLECFNKKDKHDILLALDLMLELHVEQKDRPDGMPYISHPLEIADELLEKYNIQDRDIVIAALLHDSVEDQSYLLAKKFAKRKNIIIRQDLPEKDLIENLKINLRKAALMELEIFFGEKVRNIISNLSNPDFAKIISQRKENGEAVNKNELYKKHVSEIISNDDSICAVKFVDFSRNALAIHNIKNKKKKIKLQNKYGPVIKDVFLPFFKNIKEDHLLYKNRTEIIEKLEKYLGVKSQSCTAVRDKS